jgi:4-hydroxybenzoate polyprenyltransferase
MTLINPDSVRSHDERPTDDDQMDRRGLWRRLYWVHRMEFPFPIFYVCHAVWGACWASTSAQQLLTVPVIALFVANVCHMTGEVVFNAALDEDADTRNPQKREVADAARGLGRKVLVRLGLAELTLAMLISGAIAILQARPSICVWMAAIVVLQILYNLEPVRFKRRGLVNPLVLGLTYAALPAVPAYLVLQPAVSSSMVLAIAGMLLLASGRVLWWSIPDREADVGASDLTPVVRLGVRRSLVLACGLATIGTVLIGASLGWRYGPVWALTGVAAASAFVVVMFRQLSTAWDADHFNSTRMRRRHLPLALLADAAVALIPLAAISM